MNKKQMIKEQKRLKQERKEVATLFKDDKEVYNVFKIALGVILFIGIIYAGINILNGNWNLFTKKNVPVTEIDSKMVMVGTMFNKEENEYLVLAYDINDKAQGFYAPLIDSYSGTFKLYILDLGSGFNKDFIGDKSNISTDLTKLKFSGPTLLVINKDKITKSYTSEKEIIDYLSKK